MKCEKCNKEHPGPYPFGYTHVYCGCGHEWEVANISLLIPRNYFARYAILVGQYGKSEPAWLRLEQELFEQTGGHRFTTLQAFQMAMSRHHAGHVVSSVVLKLIS